MDKIVKNILKNSHSTSPSSTALKLKQANKKKQKKNLQSAHTHI